MNMNSSESTNFWIVFTILIVLSIFIPVTSIWYFYVNLITLIIVYYFYGIFMKTGQYGWAIFEAAISAIWFDSYFKAPFGSSKTISIILGIVGLVLMIIAIIFEIRRHREE